MLILLLPTTFTLVFLALCGYHVNRRTPLADWGMSFLQAATLLGGYMVIFSEILSFFNALTTFWVALFWSAALIFTSVIGWRKGWFKSGIESLRRGWTKPGWFDILAGSIVALILFLLFVVAVKSPINNNDSLQYHMARVAHWIQNQDLHHYPTSFIPQLAHPIYAELAILNGMLLAPESQTANLIQWACLVGSMIGVAAITQFLGGNTNRRWGSLAFAISIPIGVLEATSTQNDLVVSLWTISLVFFIFRTFRQRTSKLDILVIGLVIGLGMLTKGTFFPYAIFPLIILVIFLFKNNSIKNFILYGVFISLIAISLNIGNWSRNYATFGTPLGSKEFVTRFTSQTAAPITVFSGVTRNILQNFATPEENINHLLEKVFESIFMKIEPSVALVSLEWGWNHEDIAGSPIHILLIITGIMTIFIFRNKVDITIIGLYLLTILGMFISLSAIVRYDPYGNRYQLPFFFASAPLIGIALSIPERSTVYRITTILLLLSAFPWVLFNRTRPLIAMRDSSDPFTIPCLAGCTTGSILIEPPEKTMFAVWGDLGFAYVESMNQVKSTGCMDIGLKLDSNDLEYAYWWLLGAPQNGMRLETIVTYPELERYLDPSFKPCAIICTTCGDQSQLFGLEKIGDYGNGRIKIFAGENYDPALP